MKKLVLLILPFLFFACSNDDLETNNNFSNKSEVISEDEIVLGNKLPNPYSVTNMERALEALGSTGANTEGVEITTTDLYVRFLPADTSQLEILYSNEGIAFFDYPLDYEIAKEGSYYKDPSIPEGNYSWLYTTVPVGFNFPANIQYEILEECFIPKDDALEIYTQLEQTSFERLGLLDWIDNSKAWLVRPSGTLKVYDTKSQTYEPIKGVKVVGHTIVKWASGFTNENGYYSLNRKFFTNLNYVISYDNIRNFTVRYPVFFGIHLMGVHGKSGHNKNISDGSVAWALSTINNSAYDYYKMCSSTGISTPPSNLKILLVKNVLGSSAPMLRRVWHPIGANSNAAWSNFFTNMLGYGLTATILNNTILKLVGPDITIKYNSNSTSMSMYNTVNHELAHASHFRTVGSEYWAKYISYIMTYGAYGDITKRNSGICAVGEMWGYAIGNIQVHDKYNTTLNYSPDDNWFQYMIVQSLISEGYFTKKQIYDCLTTDVKSHEDLKQKLIERHYDKQAIINQIFQYYGF